MAIAQYNANENSNEHIPALDGLRGLAIIWVLLHNGAMESVIGLESITGKILNLLINTGWLGVQLFFVLSGFLITSILLKAKQNKTGILLKNFYARRVLRIFPVYYVFILLIFLVVVFYPQSPEWMTVAYENKWWFLLFLNNWFQSFQDIGLPHLWSLAVEEQFYIIWPILVIFLSARQLFYTCIFIVLASLIFKIIVHNYMPDMAKMMVYVSTPARIDALAIGGILAISIYRTKNSLVLYRAAFVTLIITCTYLFLTIILAKGFSPKMAGWPVLNQTMAALMFAVLVFYSQSTSSNNKIYLFKRILSHSWLRSVGRYSYAMYIFHLPVSLLLHSYISKNLVNNSSSSVSAAFVFILDLILLFIITFSIAWGSWRLLEKPFLDLKRFFPTSISNNPCN